MFEVKCPDCVGTRERHIWDSYSGKHNTSLCSTCKAVRLVTPTELKIDRDSVVRLRLEHGEAQGTRNAGDSWILAIIAERLGLIIEMMDSKNG